jgi:uncharacterized protein YdeI (YjbR/CyaY-like superfamily)
VRPRFFATPAELRAWYEQHHASAPELWVGLHKVRTGKPSVTYREALDEALCFGWIDGVRRGGEDTWAVRFLPRKRKANWSHVNIERAKHLLAAGKMTPAGRAAFGHREVGEAKARHDARRNARLDAASERALRADPRAWASWQEQAPSYRQVIAFWVTSAKRPETKQRRLALAIRHHRRGERVPTFTPPAERARRRP